MSNKKKPNSRRLDFLPNRLNKYSIRKFTVGTASILIGATLIFGANTDDAKASEANVASTASDSTTGDDDVEPSEGAANEVNVSEQEALTDNVEANVANEALATSEDVKPNVTNGEENKQTEKDAASPDTTEGQYINLEDTDNVEKETSEETQPSQNIDRETATEKSEEVSQQQEKQSATKDVKSSETQTRAEEIQPQTTAKQDNSAQNESVNQVNTQAHVNTEQKVKNTAETLSITEEELQRVIQEKKLDVTTLTEEELMTEYLISLVNNEKKLAQPATLRSYSDKKQSGTAFLNAADSTGLTEIVGLNDINSFNVYGRTQNTQYATAFLNDNGRGYREEPALKLTPNPSLKGVLELNKTKFDFTKDFSLNFKVANPPMGRTGGSDGFAFIFTQSSGQEVYNRGSILNNTGVPNSGGFKIDTSLTPNGPDRSALPGGNNNEGYASFVKSNSAGTSELVGAAPVFLDRKLNNLPDKRFLIQNTTTRNTEVSGQRLIPVSINYDAATQQFSAEYQKKLYTASLSDLGLIRGQKYNFDIASTVPTNPVGERNVGEGIIQISSIAVDGNQADDNTPGYNGGSTKPGVGVNIPQTGDTQLPPNTRFEIPQGGVPSGWTVTVDPNNGTVTATPPANAQPGTSVDIPVRVTYPDGSVDNTRTNVRVVPNDAQENTPGYEDGNTTPGNPVTVPQTGDTELPPGTKFEVPPTSVPEDWTVTVDPDNGEVTVTPPADAEPGTSVDIPVKVTYPDGSTEETPVKVTVTPNQAQENTPGYEDGSTTPGNPVTVPQTGDTELPPGTKFEVPPTSVPEDWTVTVDPDNGTVTVTPPADAEPGTSVDIPIKVTYPDGSTEETPVKVT
ncbi:hypothetical protein DOS71_03350, partial [Staphylococcus felis]|uniref:YPDG domain-containing protein n=2 Tax=Staphylococcus felis TaxID=46127 RepID=UPI000E27479B